MMSASEVSSDDISGDKDVRAPNFEADAQDIQNWASRHVRTVMAEAQHFCKYFGTSMHVDKTLWDLLLRDDLLPEGGRLKHLLCALHFLKVYPKQSPGCFAVGTSTGIVDLKTHRKPW